jgi:hypothetical protein
MKGIFALFALVIFCIGHSRAQDYIQYQRYFNRIDREVKSKNFREACLILDTVDRQYEFVFAKHCMMALQICCQHNDSARASIWLKRSFRQGIPSWIIRQDYIASRCLNYKNTLDVWNAYDSLRTVYKSSIDTALANRIKYLMSRDMRYTRKVNDGFFLLRYTLYGIQWIHSNSVIHKELKSIIEERVFPGERLIGLTNNLEDSVKWIPIIGQDGLNNYLIEGKAFFMLLHYFSTPRNHINPLLFKSVVNGNLPVENYARISDYQYLNSKHRKHDSCYYTHSLATEEIDIVDKRRFKIGLFTYAQQKQNKDLYWARKRAGTLLKEIIYE